MTATGKSPDDEQAGPRDRAPVAHNVVGLLWLLGTMGLCCGCYGSNYNGLLDEPLEPNGYTRFFFYATLVWFVLLPAVGIVVAVKIGRRSAVAFFSVGLVLALALSGYLLHHAV